MADLQKEGADAFDFIERHMIRRPVRRQPAPPPPPQYRRPPAPPPPQYRRPPAPPAPPPPPQYRRPPPPPPPPQYPPLHDGSCYNPPKSEPVGQLFGRARRQDMADLQKVGADAFDLIERHMIRRPVRRPPAPPPPQYLPLNDGCYNPWKSEPVGQLFGKSVIFKDRRVAQGKISSA